ncbi:TAXI family TRAP transporter solute-binding subunit [Salibacterium aidingense]|uniref:TAXI family TRAP transporter solute-binding subunit n=1 Tax=Salibacterium aidingense TaxID=384933 RepID=UPI0004217429|nr:TAXI family TRAP transporter solute-binding subunit [Salibacterium aidingense]
MKKIIKKSFNLVLVFTVTMAMVGCGKSGSETSSREEGADQSNWPRGLSVGSAPSGGTFNVYGTGWADIMTDEVGINMTVESTGGPIDNIELVERGDMDVGMVTMGPAYEGFKGIEWAEQKHQNIRSIFPMYISYLHWFTMPDSGIKSLEDISGKVIGTGAEGGTPDYYTQRAFQELGIEPQRIVNGSFSDYANQMRDGQMDVAGVFAPAGHPTITEMVQTDGVEVFGVEEKSEELAEKFDITHGELSADSYENQEEEIDTLSIYSAFVVHKDLPEDLVYEMVKATYESKEKLAEVHQTGKDLSLDNVKEGITSIPLHPGAIKYYEEEGIDLPDSAYSEE